MKKIFILLIFIGNFLATTSAQQYPLFTNYLLNGYGFNPAMTGISGMTEIRAMYRSQWVGVEGAPQTALVNLQGKLPKLPIALGGYFYSDNAGRLGRTGVAFSLALQQKLGKEGLLSLGVTGGYYNVKLSDQFFPRDPISQDATLANGKLGMWVPDLSMGVYFKSKGLWLGVSIPQLINKKIVLDPAFQPTNPTALERHYYGMAGYRAQVNEKMEVEPSALVKIFPSLRPQYDASLRVIFDKKFWIGGSYRTEDALAAMIGIEQPKYFVAYAYDVTTSQLNTKSSGSHEITLGLRFGGKCKDEDGDGICDKDDKCPKEPGTKENQGCPEKKKDDEKCPDKDGDGICDKDDQCPDVPGTKAMKGCPFQDRDGDGVRDDVDKCPDVPGAVANEGCPLSDRDKDGILDEIDPCPDVAGPLSNSGCPPENDRDKDGTPDIQDACPDVAGPKENKGCPVGGDRDGDGIPDDKDPCPNTAGPTGSAGCPTPSAEDKELLQIAIQNLYFDTDKWAIRPTSYRNLNNVAQLLKDKKDWKIKITGHADLRGSVEHNLMLSKNRANAARNYLVSKGVPPSLLIMEYYGASQPAVDTNVKDAGKLQLNRRVELEFVFD